MAGISIARKALGRIFSIGAALLLALAGAAPAWAGEHASHLTLIVPGAAGGGWDLTAKAIKHALEAERIVGTIDIVRYPGTGGLVGLAQFVANHRGEEDVLLVGGLSMLGAAIADDAAISLRDVVPVARLSGDWGLIAVRADSPIRDIEDLKLAIRTRSNGLRWSGGSLGSPDQALVWNIANQLGVPLDDVLYYGKAGGRRAADLLRHRKVDVAVSGYAEFGSALKSGEFRAIAVDSPTRIPGLDVPTLRESGLDVSIMNWRGVFAAPGLTPAQQDRLGRIIATMQATPTWRADVAASRWSAAYLDSDGFSRFIGRESTRWPGLINPPARDGDGTQLIGNDTRRPAFLWALGVIVLALAAAAALLLTRLRERKRSELALQSQCGELSHKLRAVEEANSHIVLEGIQDDFGEWKLSFAERDVAWFMLRGLPMKQIAGLRGTSERTVRQQAQAIYRKAGLESRSDLAGRVLERFI